MHTDSLTSSVLSPTLESNALGNRTSVAKRSFCGASPQRDRARQSLPAVVEAKCIQQVLGQIQVRYGYCREKLIAEGALPNQNRWKLGRQTSIAAREKRARKRLAVAYQRLRSLVDSVGGSRRLPLGVLAIDSRQVRSFRATCCM